MTKRKWGRALATASVVALIPVGVFATAAPASAATCTTRVASDFNGDGFADVATGEPNRTVVGVQYAGAVQVNYGSASGVTTSGRQYFDQNTSGIAGAPNDSDGFGAALASGYFNDDCYADLIVGTPGENDASVLYGSAAGLTTTSLRFAGNLSGSGFGASLASGDFNHDGFDDVVAGAPGATDGGKTGSGEVGIMYGSATGLQAPTFMNQSTNGVPGAAETSDYFGLSVAAGDFTGDGYADIAIGAPYENNGSITDGGSVTILKGSASGIVTAGSQLFTQDSTNVSGTDEAGDLFGYSLATGDVSGDGYADLVVGVPTEDVGSTADAGDIVYLPGSASGVTGTGSKSFSQSTSGVAGTAANSDIFGLTVAVADFNGDGKADVAVGVPNDATGTVRGGTVAILPGTSTGPTATGSQSLSQNTSGVPGGAENGDWFGSTLHAAYTHGGTAADLVIAAQFEDTGTTTDNGTVVVLPGVQGSGLTGTGSLTISEMSTLQNDGEFGAALS